ncbi:PAS domain-containing sensor histidine kinase [Vitiosangium sp. GDMCC 1.1324]|uniref:sensor histidine kinase n=1 Tax=Vitiosangium sp. (strain GDMCC 1.1324) TaxID=2138576 RepID=UPI000D345358|nr:PAS domain-containing sensor histidine kinase [Vitiosangium sp. GDMCC 1.1324]PTL78700.1 PAS domain-containing sensor histidine kinase [Vitiosangium sp. GDMCC 1.1324]
MMGPHNESNPLEPADADVAGERSHASPRERGAPSAGGALLAIEPTKQVEQHFRLLVESVRDYAIFMLDPKGYVSSWNEGAQRIKQYRAEEIIGQHFSRFYPAEDLERGKPAWELTVATAEGRFEDEGWRVRKDGSRFWANVIITALRDPKTGELRGFAKVTRDFTERMKMEQALRQSEERFRLLVEGVQDYAICMLDPDGNVATWNAGARGATGYQAGEIIGQPVSRFYTPEERGSGEPERQLEVAREQGRYEEEGWRVRKDGSRFWANVVITALRNETGELRGFSHLARDITAKRQSEEQRHRLAAALEAVRTREEFLSIAGHELKTPITSLQLHIQSLSGIVAEKGIEALGPAKVQRTLDVVNRQVQRLTKLISSLLDVSRVTGGRLELDPQEVELSGLVREVCARFSREAEQADCSVSVVAPEGVMGRWDPLRIDQVFTNLLSNALKYGAGKPIEVRLERDSRVARVRVKDHGIGISPENKERLFGRFERLVSSRQYGGFGLGLWISRQMVEAHGGTIKVDSTPGEGSTFTVELPLEGPPPAAKAPTPS